MISKETVLFYADNREDKLVLSGIYDNYRKTSARGIATYSSFMSDCIHPLDADHRIDVPVICAL